MAEKLLACNSNIYPSPTFLMTNLPVRAISYLQSGFRPVPTPDVPHEAVNACVPVHACIHDYNCIVT